MLVSVYGLFGDDWNLCFCALILVSALFLFKYGGGNMDFWYISVLPIVGGIIWFLISTAMVKAPGTLLQQKFVNLGTLKGKTLSQITNACGNPSSISTTSNGTKVYQWISTGYHIVLLFDENDICLGVSSETKV